MSAECNCYCRTKSVAADAFGLRKRRVRYCCWCGAEKPTERAKS